LAINTFLNMRTSGRRRPRHRVLAGTVPAGGSVGDEHLLGH
jgi:hypothetical protein